VPAWQREKIMYKNDLTLIQTNKRLRIAHGIKSVAISAAQVMAFSDLLPLNFAPVRAFNQFAGYFRYNPSGMMSIITTKKAMRNKCYGD